MDENTDVDALYAAATETSNTERPMSDPPAPQAPAAPAFEIAFKARGEERKITDVEQAKQLLSKGYDYSELVSEIKKKEDALSVYKNIDDYAKQNPSWWDHVEKSFTNKDKQDMMQSGTPRSLTDSSVSDDVKPILQDLLQFKNSILEQRRIEKEKNEDAILDKEISEIKEQFKNVDFSSLDKDGRTLEQRILRHANEKSINSFKSAAKDYLFDDLVKLAEERGKESIKRGIEERSKLGLLGTSKAPLKEFTSPVDLKQKSYEDLLKEALEEMQELKK